MARELLRYRPADDLYDEWLYRITELVNAAGEAPAPTYSSRPPSPLAGNEGHGVPAPPPFYGAGQEVRYEAPWREPPRRAHARDE